MKLKYFIVAIAWVCLLSGCKSSQEPALDREQIGAMGGAIAGSWAGSRVEGNNRTTAIMAGTLLGGYLGQKLGAYLDQRDMQEHHNASHHALEDTPTGVTSNWQNPQSGASGTVKPVHTYKDTKGRYCREYTQTVNIRGTEEQSYNKACRRADGTWEVIQ